MKFVIRGRVSTDLKKNDERYNDRIIEVKEMKNETNTKAGSKYDPGVAPHIEEFLLERGREKDADRKRWSNE